MIHVRTMASSSWRYLLPVVLLLLMFAQIVSSTTRNSLTIDEGLHITSGYSILKTGDYRLIEEHPPLVKFIAAWPLLLVPDLPDPRELPGWELDVPLTDSVRLVRVTERLVYDYKPLDRLVFAARLPIALLAILLGAVVFRWGADGFGWWSGGLALFLIAFDPNILAHAGVAATDLGTAAFVSIALFTLQRFLRRPTARRWALSGLALGLALGTKLSTMLLLPTQGLLVLLYAVRCTRSVSTYRSETRSTLHALRRRFVLRILVAYAGMVVLAALVLWALYSFEFGPVPTMNISLPAASHAIPWLRLREHMQSGHTAFLLGQVAQRGWWYYFPVALLLKTPLPILLAWVAALIPLLIGPRRHWQRDLALLLFPAVYLVTSLQSSLNIGYRHLLPILPCLAVFAGRLAARFKKPEHPLPKQVSKIVASVGIGLGLWLILGTVILYPHYLAYFNELGGGPDGGYRYLVDSNTDWGQALKELAHYQDENDIESFYLSMFTFLDPAIYGVRYQPLTPMHGDTPAVFPSRFNPPPGVYVISTTTLQGIPLADPEMFDWFRHRAPDARIAHVMSLYHVREPAEPYQWLAQCTVPVIPLTPEAVAEGFGRADVRRAYFDCAQSWLIPNGGRSSGWYALFRETATNDDPFIAAHLTPTQLSFEQTRSSSLPPFAIYEAITVPPAPSHPSSLSSQVGDLEFLGHTVEPAHNLPNHQVQVWTFWQVSATPSRPLSLMLHLVGPGGMPVVVGDGLGVSVENWQAGDVIIQRHLLNLPPDAPGGDYSLYTGAYWLDTLDRWPIVQDEQVIGNQLSLPPVQIATPLGRP